MKMRAVLILVPLLACGSSGHSGPPTVDSVALPSGAALEPYPGATPLPRPEGMALSNGNVFIALSNLDSTFAVSGPSLLAEYVPSSGSTTLIDLGGADGKQCKSAGFVRESNGLLYAVCGGDFNDGSGTALVEVNPEAHAVTRRVAIPTSPAGVAAGPSRFWVGDAFGGNVYAIDKTSFTVVAGPIVIPCPSTGTFTTTNDVLVSGGDLYALCSNNTGGVLSRLDAITGAFKMQADAGPTSVAIADIGDGRLAIASGADNSLRIVTVTASALNVQVFATVFVGATATLQDIRARGQLLYTVASGSNTVQKIDLNASGGPKVVAEANTGTGANPWNIVPLDDNDAVVSNLGTNNLVKVAW